MKEESLSHQGGPHTLGWRREANNTNYAENMQEKAHKLGGLLLVFVCLLFFY